MILKLGMQHSGLKLYNVCTNDDPKLTNLTENLRFKNVTPGNCLPRDKKHLCDHYFQMSSLKLFGQLKPNSMYSLLRKEDINLFRWSCSHDQDGCHAHVRPERKTFKNLLWNSRSHELETWHRPSGLYGTDYMVHIFYK